MTILYRITIISLVMTLFVGLASAAEKKHRAHGSLQLSPKTLKLLRAEMRLLLTGIQSLAKAIATADWKSVAQTSAQINASYIFKKNLSTAQRKELKTALPEHFKRLDSNFHLEAKKLESAARNHDAQLATFHYYRLIEACTACHSNYATSKFPGFVPATKGGHHHH